MSVSTLILFFKNVSWRLKFATCHKRKNQITYIHIHTVTYIHIQLFTTVCSRLWLVNGSVLFGDFFRLSCPLLHCRLQPFVALQRPHSFLIFSYLSVLSPSSLPFAPVWGSTTAAFFFGLPLLSILFPYSSYITVVAV